MKEEFKDELPAHFLIKVSLKIYASVDNLLIKVMGYFSCLCITLRIKVFIEIQ
jgi:hypothetical protein